MQKLFNKEITSHISISDRDVTDFYNANKTSFNFPEPQIHLAQILVTPHPDPNVRNLKSDKAQNDEQARKKIDMLMARLQQGEDFAHAGAEFFRRHHLGAQRRRPRIRSRIGLEKANPELRKAIQAASPGQVTQRGADSRKATGSSRFIPRSPPASAN